MVRLHYSKCSERRFSWARFEDVFEDQFIALAEKTCLYRNFLDLKQGDGSVSEYQIKFNDFSSSFKKNEKFVMGMRKEF